MTKTTPTDAARVQSTQTKLGNDHGKNSFPSRMQSAGARNVNAGIVPPSGGARAGAGGGAARTGGGGGGAGKGAGGSAKK